MYSLPGTVAAFQIREVFVTHAHQPLNGPDAPVAGLTIYHEFFVFLEFFDPVSDVGKRHVNRSGYMPFVLVFLLGADVEEHHSFFLIKLSWRYLFDPPPSQDAEQLENQISPDN